MDNLCPSSPTVRWLQTITLILQTFWMVSTYCPLLHDKLLPLTFPQFGLFPFLRSHPWLSLSVYSPLCGSLPLLTLPVIYSIHPRATAGLFSEHYSLFWRKPQRGELIGAQWTQPTYSKEKERKHTKTHRLHCKEMCLCASGTINAGYIQ